MSEHQPIEIYYADVCGLCHKALAFFRERGLPVKAYEVFWDADANRFIDSPHVREMYTRCGAEVDFVPQLFVNGQHIAGWRRLEPMIESGEFDALLRGQ